MRILIVDDTIITRTLLRKILEKNGHEVFEAANLKSAVIAFRTQPPDFVFSDLNLGEDSALSLLSAVGSMFPDVPFVLMTASQNEKDLQASRAVGILETISKPLDQDLILKVIEKHRPKDATKRPGM